MRTAKETATRIARKTGVTCDAVPGGAPGHAYIVGRRGAWAATSREAWRIARLEARGITAQGTYTIDATGVHACPPVVPESRDAIVAAALRDGFTHVMTASGPVPLDDWQPYGTGVPHPWRGTWTGRDTVEDVGPDGDRLGVWTFVRVADAGVPGPVTSRVGPTSSGPASPAYIYDGLTALAHDPDCPYWASRLIRDCLTRDPVKVASVLAKLSSLFAERAKQLSR